jgi:hypothetical protein
MKHSESRVTLRVHSSARPLTVSFLPNSANHKKDGYQTLSSILARCNQNKFCRQGYWDQQDKP